MIPGACSKIVSGHATAVAESPGSDNPRWKDRHIAGWCQPLTNGELAIKKAIEAYALFADGYTEDMGDISDGMGTDGYFGEHALGMLQAINASLSMGYKSRFDSGAINRLLLDLARASGVNPDDV
jgi:hypothetical protein